MKGQVEGEAAVRKALSLLDTREQTHGDFRHTAARAQDIKGILSQGMTGRSPIANEALDMIASKLARIVSGRWDEVDHWRDIAGYAELVVKDLSR